MVVYKDRLLIIAGVPLINFLNYYLTYPSIHFSVFFFTTFFIDSLTGYVAWLGARRAIIHFDKTLPWENHISRRIAIQLPIVIAIVLGVIIISTELTNFIFRSKPVPVSFYLYDLFLFLIWALVINVVYAGLYFFYQYNDLKKQKEKGTGEMVLNLKLGKTVKPVVLNTVQCFFVANELVYCLNHEGKIPAPGFTLDKLEKLCSPAVFFRANRQYIITRQLVDATKRDDNGKLSLSFKSQFDLPGPIIISRLRAAAFKEWMGEKEDHFTH